MIAPDLPRLAEVRFDARVVVFVAIATLASGVLAGIPPVAAVLAGRVGASEPGRRTARSGASRAHQPDARRLGGRRVRARAAAAAGRGPAAQQLPAARARESRLRADPPGERRRGAARERATRTTRRRRLSSAGWSRTWPARPASPRWGCANALPPDNGGNTDNFNLVDHPVPPGNAEPVAPVLAATASYFRTLGVPLLEGRLFTRSRFRQRAAGDRGEPGVGAPLLPARSAVGSSSSRAGATAVRRTTIVGVVGDVKYLGIAGSGEAFYVPLTQSNSRVVHVVVRTAAAPGASSGRCARRWRPSTPNLPRSRRRCTTVSTRRWRDPRRWTTVLGGFAAAALLLAALGIFGLMSYVVRQRRREMGIRLALGAEPATLTWLVVASGMRYVWLGTAIGLVLAALEGRWLSSLLFGVSAIDTATVAAAGGAARGDRAPGLLGARVAGGAHQSRRGPRRGIVGRRSTAPCRPTPVAYRGSTGTPR